MRFLKVTAMLAAFFASTLVIPHTVIAETKTPSSTTATFGDWIVRCRTIKLSEKQAATQNPESNKNICEMVHTINVSTMDKRTGKPSKPQLLAQVALGKLPNSKNFKVVYQVPSAVWLREAIAVRFAADSKNIAKAASNYMHKASYFRCIANACLADADLSDDMLTAIMSSKVSQISFKDGSKRTINIPMSLKGFKEAFASLRK